MTFVSWRQLVHHLDHDFIFKLRKFTLLNLHVFYCSSWLLRKPLHLLPLEADIMIGLLEWQFVLAILNAKSVGILHGYWHLDGNLLSRLVCLAALVGVRPALFILLGDDGQVTILLHSYEA